MITIAFSLNENRMCNVYGPCTKTKVAVYNTTYKKTMGVNQFISNETDACYWNPPECMENNSYYEYFAKSNKKNNNKVIIIIIIMLLPFWRLWMQYTSIVMTHDLPKVKTGDII